MSVALAHDRHHRERWSAHRPARLSRPPLSRTGRAASSSSSACSSTRRRDSRREKQKQDQRECYAWAKEQTGYDPMTAAAANKDSAAKAAKEQTAQATKGEGGQGRRERRQRRARSSVPPPGTPARAQRSALPLAAWAAGRGRKRPRRRPLRQGGHAAASRRTRRQTHSRKRPVRVSTGRGYTFSK